MTFYIKNQIFNDFYYMRQGMTYMTYISVFQATHMLSKVENIRTIFYKSTYKRHCYYLVIF